MHYATPASLRRGFLNLTILLLSLLWQEAEGWSVESLYGEECFKHNFQKEPSSLACWLMASGLVEPCPLSLSVSPTQWRTQLKVHEGSPHLTFVDLWPRGGCTPQRQQVPRRATGCSRPLGGEVIGESHCAPLPSLPMSSRLRLYLVRGVTNAFVALLL